MSTKTENAIPNYGEVKNLISTQCIKAIHYTKSTDILNTAILDEIINVAFDNGIISEQCDITLHGCLKITNLEDIDYCGIPLGSTFDPTYGYLYINMFKIVIDGRKNECVAALSYKDEDNTYVTNAVKFYVDNGLFKIADKNGPANNKATYDWDIIAYLTSRT